MIQHFFGSDRINEDISIRSCSKSNIISFIEKRSKFSPDVPCAAELGYKGLGAPVFYYLFAPKGLDADAKAKLMKLCEDVAADPTFEKDVANNTIEPDCKVGEEAHAFFAAAKAEMIKLGMGEGFKK